MKKLTVTIARLLAQKVNDKMREKTEEYKKALTPKILASKEMKEFVKLESELKALNAKIDEKRKQVSDKFSKDGYCIRVHFNNDKGDVSISCPYRGTYEIADMLILEDFFSDGSTTPEEVVDKMVNKLLKGK